MFDFFLLAQSATRFWLSTAFCTAMLVTAVFLILLVLVQRGRGGGLAGAFGGAGGQSAFGAKAGDTFTKVTIYGSTFWILLCIAALAVLNPAPNEADATPQDGMSAVGETGTGDGTETDDTETDGEEVTGTETDDTEADSTETDGVETDGAETEGVETDGVETDGTEVDGEEVTGEDGAAEEGTDDGAANGDGEETPAGE